jgi:hypothetical protein
MADLSANAYLRAWGELHTDKFVMDNSAAQEVFEGAPLFIDISEDTSYPRLWDSGETLATGDAFLGFAAEYVNVLTTDTEGDNEIDVIRPPSIVGFKSSSFTRANIGDSMYMSDSATLTTTAGSNLKIGTIHDVRDGWVYVKLEYWQSS